MDPTEEKPAGWYLSTRIPGMERYWDGTFWTENYRPAQELQGQFGIASNSSEENPVTAEEPKQREEPSEQLWDTLSNSPQGGESLLAPGAKAEYVAPPQQGQPQHYYYPLQSQRQSAEQGLSIAALITAFFAPLVGAILGHVAFSKAQRTNSPTGVALAAIIVGWAFFALFAVVWLPFLFGFASIFNGDYDRRGDYSIEFDNNIAEGAAVPSYVVSSSAQEKLSTAYPQYATWQVFCSEDLPLEAGAEIVCPGYLYPFRETNESESFDLTVTYLEGDTYSPVISVQLLEPVTALEDFPKLENF